MNETNIILRSLLLQFLKAEDLQEARDAVENLCTKDDIAAVMSIYNEQRKRKEAAEEK